MALTEVYTLPSLTVTFDASCVSIALTTSIALKTKNSISPIMSILNMGNPCGVIPALVEFGITPYAHVCPRRLSPCVPDGKVATKSLNFRSSINFVKNSSNSSLPSFARRGCCAREAFLHAGTFLYCPPQVLIDILTASLVPHSFNKSLARSAQGSTNDRPMLHHGSGVGVGWGDGLK